MPNVLILTEVQEAMRARYKAMLLERFPQLTINVVGHHNDVGPYIADTNILLCFSPPMADHVVRDAPAVIQSRGLADRVTIESGSFFERVPVGGDAYLLSHIIHDWSEAQCLTILGHCRRLRGVSHGLLDPGNHQQRL